MKLKCLSCGTTDPKRFSGDGVCYCDECVQETATTILSVIKTKQNIKFNNNGKKDDSKKELDMERNSK